jgi:hypothetical protein
VGKPLQKQQLEIPRRRCEDNVKMEFGEINYEGVKWTELVQGHDHCLTLAALNL